MLLPITVHRAVGHGIRRCLRRFWPDLYTSRRELIKSQRQCRELGAENTALKQQLGAVASVAEADRHSLAEYLNGLEEHYSTRYHEQEERIEALEKDNRELQELSSTDLLTGLSNRRGLERFYGEESLLARTVRVRDGEERRRFPKMAAIAFDLDHFKRVNDECGGHAAGDQVLVAVAELMQHCFGHRPEDIVCRLGGDEFLVVLPRADMVAAYKQAFFFLAAVRNDERLRFGDFSVTASIGVAEIEVDPRRPSEAILTDLLGMADQAIYRAKELGRNTVVRYDTIEVAQLG